MPKYDAIVVGSGAGGSSVAYKLAKAGKRVLLIEKGPFVPRDASTLDVRQVFVDGVFSNHAVWSDGRGGEFVPSEFHNVGGKTKWYGAALLRYGRHEFEADPAHQCLGWPIDYDELRPYYEEAESLLGIRSFAAEPDLVSIIGRLRRAAGSWRSESLPLGLAKSILEHPLEASRFDGFASVAGLKADGETAFLSKLRGLPNLKLLTGVAAVELVGGRDNPRRVVGVRLADGRVLHARAVLLAAGALHSPRLLAQYLGTSGLAQQLPAAANVGRNLKLHLLTAVVAVSLSRKTDVIRKTTLLLNDALPHSSIQPLGFNGELIATLVPQVVPRVLARQIGQRAYGFFLQTEDGSHADNRVSAGAVPTMDYDATRSAPALQQHERLVTTFKRSLGKAGLLAFSERIGLAGTAHACGTLVTGTDPQRSVVDASGRVHGMEALYVVDGSILPRSSRVNPSLTIYSWSVRVARALALRLQDAPSERREVVLS
jgi:choline dehydrogenase-like flavoprotein